MLFSPHHTFAICSCRTFGVATPLTRREHNHINRPDWMLYLPTYPPIYRGRNVVIHSLLALFCKLLHFPIEKCNLMWWIRISGWRKSGLWQQSLTSSSSGSQTPVLPDGALGLLRLLAAGGWGNLGRKSWLDIGDVAATIAAMPHSSKLASLLLLRGCHWGAIGIDAQVEDSSCWKYISCCLRKDISWLSVGCN